MPMVKAVSPGTGGNGHHPDGTLGQNEFKHLQLPIEFIGYAVGVRKQFVQGIPGSAGIQELSAGIPACIENTI